MTTQATQPDHGGSNTLSPWDQRLPPPFSLLQEHIHEATRTKHFAVSVFNNEGICVDLEFKKEILDTLNADATKDEYRNFYNLLEKFRLSHVFRELDNTVSLSSGPLQKKLKMVGELYCLRKIASNTPLAKIILEDKPDRKTLSESLAGFYDKNLLSATSVVCKFLDREYQDKNSLSETTVLSGCLFGLTTMSRATSNWLISFLRNLSNGAPRTITDLHHSPLSKETVLFLNNTVDRYRRSSFNDEFKRGRELKEELAKAKIKIACLKELANEHESECKILYRENNGLRVENDGLRVENDGLENNVIKVEARLKEALEEIGKNRREIDRLGSKLRESAAEKKRLGILLKQGLRKSGESQDLNHAKGKMRNLAKKTLAKCISKVLKKCDVSWSSHADEMKKRDADWFLRDNNDFRLAEKQWTARRQEVYDGGCNIFLSSTEYNILQGLQIFPSEWFQVADSSLILSIPKDTIYIKDTGWNDGIITVELPSGEHKSIAEYFHMHTVPFLILLRGVQNDRDIYVERVPSQQIIKSIAER